MENNLKTKAFSGVLSGEIVITPDKSISHRAVILSALLNSKIKIKNLSLGMDCISTLKIFEKLGVKYEFISERDLICDSSDGLKIPKENITFDCGNSGTTTRLLCGLFSSLGVNCTFVGDESLSKRPMKRIIEPLEKMGAKIKSNENKLPITISESKLKGVEYCCPIASAQVKSALLLAGLYADGVTKVYEPFLSRNHSELMLNYFGAEIKTGQDEKGNYCQIKKSKLIPKDVEVTGDISSAAFFMVAAAIVPNSEVLIKNVGINPTRSGILDVFKQAQINYKILNERIIGSEKTADIKVCYTPDIKPFKIEGGLVPRLIDEIPALAVLASQACGLSTVRGAKDLRNKESDRIKTVADAFLKLGIKIKEFDDGFEIEGKTEINKSAELETYLDHRLAMSYFVLSLINKKEMIIRNFDCVNTSFPEFLELMREIGYGE